MIVDFTTVKHKKSVMNKLIKKETAILDEIDKLWEYDGNEINYNYMSELQFKSWKISQYIIGLETNEFTVNDVLLRILSD